MPFFGPKKEEKTRLFRALSSSLVQRYNIFRRNPNYVNISQQSINSPFAAICSRRGLRCCILRAGILGGLGGIGQLDILQIAQRIEWNYLHLSFGLLGFLVVVVELSEVF